MKMQADMEVTQCPWLSAAANWSDNILVIFLCDSCYILFSFTFLLNAKHIWDLSNENIINFICVCFFLSTSYPFLIYPCANLLFSAD